MLTQAPRGTFDILPADSYRWREAEEKMRRICALAGYREIRTPTFEHTELFQRGVGDATDVVQKEMYTFFDKGDRSITLRPEGTAGVARAFIEAHMYADPLPTKMYYVSVPLFRYEKPQAGRLREHHQFGVEVFGAKDASCDAEVISIAHDVLSACGIDGLKLSINSIGCPACRAEYLKTLREYLLPRLPELCETCNERYARNPMRILDCKVDAGKLTGAPSMVDMLCDECAGHFESVKSYLSGLGLGYVVDPQIVRGLDYYSKTVFEFITDTPNGPLTVCGGGRYDGLVEALGGPPTPGLGFGMGVERLLMVQAQRGIAREQGGAYDAFVCTLGSAARHEGMKLIKRLRESGVRADIDHAARSLKAQFKYADKMGAPFVVIVADDELGRGVYKLRDMSTGSEAELNEDELIGRLTACMEG